MSLDMDLRNANVVARDVASHNTIIITESLESIFDKLNGRIAPGAAFDSFQRQSASKCLENTHQDVIAQISTWADDIDQPPICWLFGPADAGKSTIAQTIAELYATQTNDEYPKGRLAASFFFSRGNKDLCAARFFPTIAYQLAISLPRIQKGIEMALKDDPSIVSKRLEVQFMKLILDPIDTCIQSQPMIVVIDALDECEGEGSKELIRVLARTIAETYRGTHSPLRFLITSRADDHIERVLNQYTSLSYRLSLDEFRDDHEIRASLADRVSKLYQSDAHPVRRLPQPGPSDLGLNALFETAPTNTRALRILSLDGGGFRSKASLLILDSLMRAVSAKIGGQPVKPCQYFDLIAGTSTGGLVALMLGRLGYSTEEAIAKYTECVSCIFDKVGSNKTWIAAGFPRVDKRPLEHLLREIGRAGGRDAELLEDPATSTSHCRCFVTTTVPNAPGVAPILLRSYPSPSPAPPIPFGHKWKIWEAARATSAAPVYFEPFAVGSSFQFSDAGAAGCNNPTMEAIRELERVPTFENQPIECLVSIGTGLRGLFQTTPQTRPRPSGPFASIASIFGGASRVTEAPARLEALIKYFTTVASDTQKTANYVDQRMADRGCLEAYFRFDPTRGVGDFDLADISRGADIEVAAQNYVQQPHVAREIQRCAQILAKRP